MELKTYRVPVTVKMSGWMVFEAEDNKMAMMMAEEMNKEQVVRPRWETILKGFTEEHEANVKAVEEVELEPA